MATDAPPWDEEGPLPEDIDLTTQEGAVTQPQFQALLSMVRAQGQQLRELQALVAKLPKAGQPAPEGNDRHYGGRLLRGSQRGKTHAQALAADPAYVNYLGVYGWAENWGFTKEQVAEAAAWVAANPQEMER